MAIFTYRSARSVVEPGHSGEGAVGDAVGDGQRLVGLSATQRLTAGHAVELGMGLDVRER